MSACSTTTPGRVDVWKVPRRRTIRRAASPRVSPKASARVGARAGGDRLFRPRHHGRDQRADPASRRPKTGLITTDGFRDLLEIGRQKRPDLYDLQADKPPALVPRDLRLEVPERVRHDGSVEIPLDEAAFRAAVRSLRDAGVQAVAVCFLYGFVRHRA